MRHENCARCATAATADPRLFVMTVAAELLANCHHHHQNSCQGCGASWLDDIVIGGLGLPVIARRGSSPCECPDDLPQYTAGIVLIAGAEADCRCTAAKIAAAPLLAELGPS